MDAVIYCRVSTDDQSENFSLSSQARACREYAEAHGMTVFEEISDDTTGTSLDRAGLDRLRGMVRRGEIGAVIVHSSDRLTRKLAHSLILREELSKCGCELHFVNRGQSLNTPEHQMVENIEAVFAEYWKERIGEGCRRGRREKCRQGKWPGDNHPKFGYRKEGQGRESSLAIDEAEAQVVLRIFHLFVGDYGKPLGAHAIAQVLTAERVPPPSRGKQGIQWYRNTVYLILDYGGYVGKFVFGGQPVNLPELAIVPPDLWEAKEKRRKHSRAVAGQYERRFDYLLSGRMTCTCGWHMTGNPSFNTRRYYLYYDCHRKKCAGENNCKERIRADVADQVAWNWLSSLLCDENLLESKLHTYSARRESELSPKRERLETVNTLIDRQQDAIQRLAAEFAQQTNKIVQKALQEQMRMAGRDLDALEAEKAILQAEVNQEQFTEADIAKAKETVRKTRGRVEAANFQQRRELVDLFDVQARIEYQNEIRGLAITCNLTLDTEEWLSLDMRKLESPSKAAIQRPNKIVIFSTWLPIPKRASLADELFRLVLPRGVTVVND